MRITHLGHACLLIEVAGQRILIDPGAFSTFEHLRELSAVLVTHQHPDHWHQDRAVALLAANPQARVLMEAQTAQVVTAAARDADADADTDTGYADRIETFTPGTTVDLTDGAVQLTAVGQDHATIHPYVERIGNTGVVVRAPGEPVLYHPGDALDGEPGEVDLLCVPVNAPWGKVAETIAFVRRIAPTRGIIPIHDGLLNDTGRGMYLTHLGQFGADGGVEVLDLREVGATEV